MSKRDIETVCTLAAHLALYYASEHEGDHHPQASDPYAADAMRLQRLGRSIRTAYAKPSSVRRSSTLRALGMTAADILAPYGLQSGPWYGPSGLYIHGLPSNLEFSPDAFII